MNKVCAKSDANKYDAAWLKDREEYFYGLETEIKGLLDEGVFEEKRIAVLGCWNNFIEVNKKIKNLGLAINFIADNNPNKQGVSRGGIISQSVESLVNEKDVIILVLNNLYWKQLRKQLLNLDFSENIDFYVLFGGERFESLSKGLEANSLISQFAWEEISKRAFEAYHSYKNIIVKYGDLPIWLMHQPSLGDLYIFSLFLPIAMRKKNIPECDCILIVTKNSTKKLAEAIGYKYIELISFEEANKDWLVLLKLMGDKLNVYNAVYHGLNSCFQSLVWNTPVNFRDSFTKYVFQFKQDVEPIFFDFPKRKDTVLNQFLKLNLQVDKTVVISPYAGHFEAKITERQWGYLVDQLKEKGYSVCTNCGSKDEPPLKGTVSAEIELQDCVEFVERAGYFIGIRSGFCDLVCKANCQKIVIYETGAPAASIDYFGLSIMGIADNIIEIVNDCINTDIILDEILEYF